MDRGDTFQPRFGHSHLVLAMCRLSVFVEGDFLTKCLAPRNPPPCLGPWVEPRPGKPSRPPTTKPLKRLWPSMNPRLCTPDAGETGSARMMLRAAWFTPSSVTMTRASGTRSCTTTWWIPTWSWARTASGLPSWATLAPVRCRRVEFYNRKVMEKITEALGVGLIER